jgi:hypothetical protein
VKTKQATRKLPLYKLQNSILKYSLVDFTRKEVHSLKPHIFSFCSPPLSLVLRMKFPNSREKYCSKQLNSMQQLKYKSALFVFLLSLVNAKLPPGPEKYRERGSTAPRKGPSCQEGRPHLEEE